MLSHSRYKSQRSMRDFPIAVKPQTLLLVAMLLFGAFQIMVSIHKLYTLQASMMDLGDFEQEFWLISHGNWWAFSTVFQTPAFANDGSIFIYPLAYGFRFLGGAIFLFVVQAMGTAAAAWGIYRAARINRLSEWVSSVVAILFLLYPAIIGGSQFDFHPDFIALPFLVWAYVAYFSEHKTAYYVCLLLAGLSKNMALVSIAGWGVGLIIYQKQVRDGLIAFSASVALFFAELSVIFPKYFLGGTEKINLSLYGYLGHGFFGILIGIATHFPEMIHHVLQEGPYVLWILGPVLALSLLGSASVMAMLSLLALNGLSMFAAQQAVNDQYQVILAGWVFLALAEGLSRLGARRKLALFGIGAASLVLEGLFLATAVVPTLKTANSALPAVRRAVRSIPAQTVVWTQNHLGPWAYRFPIVGVDLDQVPGQMIDGLPVLWHEAHPGPLVPTALLAERPVSPYFGLVIADALRSGYRVSFHRGSVFVVSGLRRFSTPRPSPIAGGWQPPSRLRWIIPAWTQAIAVGHVDWQSLSVVVPAHVRGHVFPGLPMVLRPGIYQISAVIKPAPEKGGNQVLGALIANGHTQAITRGTAVVHLKLSLARQQRVIISLTSTGHGSFAIVSFEVRRVSSG